MSDDDPHRHGRSCYWDHLRCGWVCAPRGDRAPVAAPAAPEPAAEPVPATAGG